MPGFASHRSYQQFAESVMTRWRYVSHPEQRAFLRALLETSVARQEVIGCGSRLWRAQLGQDCYPADLTREEQPAPLDIQRMKPLGDRAREGRANPKGIPYLYLATHKDTAIAEVRPWIGAYVSIAQFALQRDVRVVNCVTNDDRIMVYAQEPEPEERERATWRDIDRAFSQPVTCADDRADYVPTQIIAEFLRANGIDGVAYRSSLGLGHNVMLFDIDVAALVNCGLVEIRALTLDWSEAANPYCVQPK